MAQTTNYNFEIPDDTDLVKDGALAMRDLGQDVDTQLFTALGGDYPGLRLIKSQAIGSGVSSVTVTGAFSATYENYKIVVSGGVSSTAQEISMALGSEVSQYFGVLNIINYASNVNTIATNNNSAKWTWIGEGNTSNNLCNIDVLNPFASKWTSYQGGYMGTNNAGVVNGVQKSTTSFTAFTISVAGTLTGGTIYVYGYGAS
jgi:hypothetical protein